MSFKVKLNNKVFDGFKGGSLTRTIDGNTGTWSFSSSIIKDFPIKAADYVQILINEIPKSTGFVDRINIESSLSTHDLTASGRDNIQDIMDSTVPDSAKQIKTPISFLNLCEQIVQAINPKIKVINLVSGLKEFSKKDFSEDVTTGEKGLTFLTTFARKRQVYLNTDGKGSLLIFKPLKEKAATKLIRKKNNESNNIISSSLSIDFSERYFEYACKTQANYGKDATKFLSTFGDEDDTDLTGYAFDRDIRKTRILEFQAEEAIEGEFIEDRAKEMLNLKRSRGTIYSCIVQGFAQENGTIWDIGQQVRIEDESVIVNGDFVITDVTFNFTLNGGSTTSITCSDITAYQSIEEAETRKSDLGDNYVTENKNPINYIDSQRPSTPVKLI